jgi:hypothetical protein
MDIAVPPRLILSDVVKEVEEVLAFPIGRIVVSITP